VDYFGKLVETRELAGLQSFLSRAIVLAAQEAAHNFSPTTQKSDAN